MNIKEKIEKLEKELKEAKEELKAKSRSFERLEKDGEYWHTISDGTTCKAVENNDEIDDGLYTVGNYFYSEKEVKIAVEKQKAITKINRYILERNEEEGFVVDWKDDDSGKYNIFFTHSQSEDEQEEWGVSCNWRSQTLQILEYTTKKIIKEVIKKFEKELNSIKQL